MQGNRFIINEKKVLAMFQLSFGALMIFFCLHKVLFTDMDVMDWSLVVVFLLQAISSLALGAPWRKTTFEKKENRLEIKKSYSNSKKSFRADLISKITMGTSYLFVRSEDETSYRLRIDMFKEKTKDELANFLQRNYPDRFTYL